MNWGIEIQSTTLDHRNLADLLAGLGFTLIDGIQFPAFTSPEIDPCKTAAETIAIAKRLRAALTGPAQIDPKFVFGSVIDYSSTPPKRHAFLEVQPAVLKVSVGSVTFTVSPPAGLSDDELEKWKKERSEPEYQAKLEDQRAKLEPAFLDPRAAKVLELLSIQNPSGETLYKIYELAEGHPTKRNAFHAQFGISRSDFSRFQDAVHNPSVNGDWARHAYHDTPKTNNPMSRCEAENYVRSIAKRWLQHVRTSAIP